jgi:hypothetical protein
MLNPERANMRKLFIAVILSTLFLGCDTFLSKQYTRVINDSDYEVTFTFDHFREIPHTLQPHTSGDYDEYPSYIIKSYSANPPRVSKTTENKITTFYNTPARPIKIINSLDKIILVTSLGCMDNEPVTVPANNEIGTLIYTSSPEFSGVTTDNFPVKFTISVDRLSVTAHW